MGINFHCKFNKTNSLFGVDCSMFKMQNVAKKAFPSFSECLKGVVTKKTPFTFPVLRTPLHILQITMIKFRSRNYFHSFHIMCVCSMLLSFCFYSRPVRTSQFSKFFEAPPSHEKGKSSARLLRVKKRPPRLLIDFVLSSSVHQNTRSINSRLGIGSIDGPNVLMEGIRGQHQHQNKQQR